MSSLTRVNPHYGVTSGSSSVLVPMPSVSALRPSDFTGDAGKKNAALIRRDRRIRVKRRVEYAFTANMHGVATDMPVKVNSGRNPEAHRLLREAAVLAYAADPTIDLSARFPIFDKRTCSRIRQEARKLS